MNKCTHTKYERWTSSWENWMTGEDVVEEHYGEVDTFEDIDTHRYKCTQCGEIGYYSGAAKNWYQNKIPTPGIKGLN